MTKAERRRGAALEAAVLDAAWQELVEVGYPRFTLEGVARRAGTSRPVLSRRWSSRTALAIAAMASRLAGDPVAVPDLGDVRDELTHLLQQWSIRAAPLARLFLDMSADPAAGPSSLADLRDEMRKHLGDQDLIGEILDRGARRGEIDRSRITPRIASVPADLIRYEILMTSRPVSDEAIAAILDQVFLPLVTTPGGR